MKPIRPGRPTRLDLLSTRQNPIPKQPGLYRIIHRETREIVYIGETADIARRAIEHLRSGRWDPDSQCIEWKVADGRSSSATRRTIEKVWIARHKPPQNGNGGGGGNVARRRVRVPVVIDPSICLICGGPVPVEEQLKGIGCCTDACGDEMLRQLGIDVENI